VGQHAAGDRDSSDGHGRKRIAICICGNRIAFCGIRRGRSFLWSILMTLEMTRLKTGVWFLTVLQADGVTPQDLTGSTVWFHAVVESLVIDKSSPSSGITITNAAGGLATLQIEPGDTSSVPNTGIHSGDCELTLQSGSENYELARGTLTILENVGTP
jgi:hypothetical protein